MLDRVRSDTAAGTRTVLVLEDEAMIAMALAFDLEDAGLKPVTAGSVEKALQIIADEPPHCAVLDVNLGPGITCEPVAERLSELDIPFILHSGDLARRGELVMKFGVTLIAKPAAGEHIARALLALERTGS